MAARPASAVRSAPATRARSAAPRRGRVGPDFELELAARARLGAAARVIGVDEVGRGPFAGPVVAGAAWLDDAAAEQLGAAGLDDSKRLTPERRDALRREITALAAQGAAAIALGAASVREIEALNILGATALAMRRAVARLSQLGFAGAPPTLALLDGNRALDLGCAVEPIVGGDGRSLSIAAAAVMAKCVRDRAMRSLAVRYPDYGWATNVGYGAAAHREAICRLGLTPHHRIAFCRNTLEATQDIES